MGCRTRVWVCVGLAAAVGWGIADVAWAGLLFLPEADTYGRRDNSGPYGSSNTLLVKYSDSGNSYADRKTWIRYDISSRAGRAISDPELLLPFIETGVGTVATGTWQFQVYGLTDESLDNWDESTAKWNDLPANITDSGNGVDLAKAVSLGTFTVEDKGVGTVARISGPALRNFLAGDTNGRLTFIVVRDTQAPSGTVDYAHGFASREHPTISTKVSLSLVENQLLTNGELEDASGNFSTTGWSNTNTTAISHAPIVPGSRKAAFMDTSKNGGLYQTVSVPLSDWVFDTYFATEVGSDANDRGFHLFLRHQPGSDQQINFRVRGNGKLEVYNGSTSSWVELSDLGVIQFSDAKGDNDFSDPGDILNVYHLRIVGRGYGTASPWYDVYLSDANQTALTRAVYNLTYFQGSAPTTGWGKQLTVYFDTYYGTGKYVVDAVYLAAVPEPGAGVLMGLALIGLVGFWWGHRRQRRNQADLPPDASRASSLAG